MRKSRGDLWGNFSDTSMEFKQKNEEAILRGTGAPSIRNEESWEMRTSEQQKQAPTEGHLPRRTAYLNTFLSLIHSLTREYLVFHCYYGGIKKNEHTDTK